MMTASTIVSSMCVTALALMLFGTPFVAALRPVAPGSSLPAGQRGTVAMLGSDIMDFSDEGAADRLLAAEARAGQINPESDQVIYDHMPKTGGTLLQHVISTSVGHQRYQRISEFGALTPEHKEEFFTIGSIRNPCDYYLSLWSYGTDHGGKMIGSVPETKQYGDRGYLYGATSPKKDSEEDIERFHKWLRAVNTPGKPGTLSVRMATSYSGNPDLAGLWQAASALEDDKLDMVTKSLADINKDSVDCWVREEYLEQEARACLELWEHNTGNVVDWAAFEKSFSPDDEADFGKVTTHAPCSTYFGQNASDFVRMTDAVMFNSEFGYTDCCNQ